MADSLFGVGVLEGIRRDQMHAHDVARTLEFLRSRLDEEGISFALLGALAMRHHGYVRHTEDVDILVTPEGLDRIHERLVGRGIRPRGPGLRKGLRQVEYKVSIDVIQTGEHAGSQESPLVYPHPDSDAFEDRGGIRVPRLERMIEFKLVSGVWGRRPDDLGDIFNLIGANGLDESFAAKLIPEVRAKFLELLEDSRQEKRLDG